ncbi:hypothetical protein PPERSA_11541 [Pseudocohnilembus persalinus]|uniref:Uncharacterized protein n=1 Tax=Pseudocohnilembus persalinus TaxID=266149 RepID=A0A0V0QXW6_PSEPJ|nr:hypothetical protein PPERSA_11541 [Pseudocohnilembus persalinus]|eukprot:KRX06896.1 hypothetical protein PPERSA_11541 [Pseudocohnilembus persalinus]
MIRSSIQLDEQGISLKNSLYTGDMDLNMQIMLVQTEKINEIMGNLSDFSEDLKDSEQILTNLDLQDKSQMDTSNSFPQLLLKNGFVLRPITDDIAERCAEIVALSFSKTNPFALALGKTFEEEKARILKNIKIHQQDPFTHCLMDGNEIVSVNFSSKFRDCYLARAVSDQFNPSEYNEKQLVPVQIWRELYLPFKDFLNDGDYLFQIYGLNPEYKKKNPSVIIYSQIFHYMSLHYKGIRELSFTTNQKMNNLILKLGKGYNLNELDHTQFTYQGRKIYDGIENGCLKLNIFGVNPEPLEEYKYLENLIPQYCEKLNLNPQYQVPENMVQKHLDTIKAIEQSQSRKLKIKKMVVPKPSL